MMINERTDCLKQIDKNIKSRKNIQKHAIKEFAVKGYGQSSVNAICASGNLSKGVLYHYFNDKDEIYIMCVQACFDALCDYLSDNLEINSKDASQSYFDSRYKFFKENPLYQNIFCEAVVSPPKHLIGQINDCKKKFDELNKSVLLKILKDYNLREDITEEQIVSVMQLFQDFVNARYKMMPGDEPDMKKHDELATKALDILLYGVVKREDNNE